MQKKLRFDEIGYWSELKLEIVKKYAAAYTSVMQGQKSSLHFAYIDAFAGAGKHLKKGTGEEVAGSPLNALQTSFEEYYFIDLNETKLNYLRETVGDRPNVRFYDGDCNEVLLKEVFPRIRYRDYQRGLCLLDPYGLHLNWEVIATAGQMRSIEIFLNFPAADINRNVLWKDPAGVDADDIARMNAFWGDESWRHVAYAPAEQGNLFGISELEKTDNDTIAEAFRTRLRDVAGFAYVLKPVPMRNLNNAIVYYLFFASQNATGARIVESIFKSYSDRKG